MGLPRFSHYLCFLFFAAGVWGQRPASKQFQWKWANDGIGFSLPTCLSLAIQVKPFNATDPTTFGVPPYYMMAFPVGGTPTTTLIGTDNTTLSWTNTNAAGSKLLLTIVDSTGSFGGVPPQIYTSIDGVTAQCVVPEPKSPTFTISSNITGKLETCQPWGITIHGGIAPYNLSIAALNSPVVTNVSIPSGFDAFTYINRADPNGQMIVAVSDFTGRWATGVPIVNTTGSANVDCTGLVSSSGVAANLAKDAAARKKAEDKKRTGIIAGVTVTVVVLVLGALGAGYWFFFVRRKKDRQAVPTSEVEPYSYQEEPLTLPQNYNSSTGFSGTSKTRLSMQESGHGLSYGSHHPAAAPSVNGSFAPSSSAFTSHDSSSHFAGDTRHTGHFTTFPSRPLSGKAAEAAQDAVVLSPESGLGLASGSGSRPIGAEEIVIQHRDGGGAVVRELPPPYADRTRETGESS